MLPDSPATFASSSGPWPVTRIWPACSRIATYPGTSRRAEAASAACLPNSPAALNCSGVRPRSRRAASARPDSLIPVPDAVGLSVPAEAEAAGTVSGGKVVATAGTAPNAAATEKPATPPQARVRRRTSIRINPLCAPFGLLIGTAFAAPFTAPPCCPAQTGPRPVQPVSGRAGAGTIACQGCAQSPQPSGRAR